MAEKILVTGFQRSGTTLLRRIVSMHPELKTDILHEKRGFLECRNKEEAESYIGSGEKLPYYATTNLIINYIDKFKEYYPDGLIFHIHRNYNDVEKSNKKTFQHVSFSIKKAYSNSVPSINNYLLEVKDAYTVNYDALIINPLIMVKSIYKYIGNCPDDEYIKKVCTTRDPWYNGKRMMCGLRYKDRIK